MKFKNKFNLSHVAGFFVGVVVTVAFNWIVFKDPKRVTAPGVAALVAICTFTLALWSAFKVDKWLNNKINDKAFKQTEKILELIENSHKYIDPLYQQYNEISHAVQYLGSITLDNKEKERFVENMNKVDSFCNELTMSINMLKYWNTKLTDTAIENEKNLIETLRHIIEMTLYIKNDQKDIECRIKITEEKFKNAFTYLNAFVNVNYSEIFEHNVTSPSQKAD